jgi:hypothetical protein
MITHDSHTAGPVKSADPRQDYFDALASIMKRGTALRPGPIEPTWAMHRYFELSKKEKIVAVNESSFRAWLNSNAVPRPRHQRVIIATLFGDASERTKEDAIGAEAFGELARRAGRFTQELRNKAPREALACTLIVHESKARPDVLVVYEKTIWRIKDPNNMPRLVFGDECGDFIDVYSLYFCIEDLSGQKEEPLFPLPEDLTDERLIDRAKAVSAKGDRGIVVEVAKNLATKGSKLTMRACYAIPADRPFRYSVGERVDGLDLIIRVPPKWTVTSEPNPEGSTKNHDGTWKPYRITRDMLLANAAITFRFFETNVGSDSAE